MDPVTHVAAGALISQVLPGPSRVWSAVAGVAFALLPDIDYFLIYSDRLAFIRDHRSFTHSLLGLVFLALLGAAVGRMIGGPRWFRPLLVLGLAILASHLLLDLATSYGTQILFPFSRRRFSLDWLFIIDPYFTALLLLGYLTTICFSARSREFGAFFLAAAGLYLLVCAFYHHQALSLARQMFPESGATRPAPTKPFSSVAALPQPFSCRRWQLIAARGHNVEQTFVQLPYLAFLRMRQAEAAATNQAVNPGTRVPQVPYRPPQDLQVQVWKGLPAPELASPKARDLLKAYLEFARFPLLHRIERREDGQMLEWVDLRFSVPGRAFPFILHLYVDNQGHLQHWHLGRGGK